MFDLVIFDCDGTLVNSEYLNNRAVADYLQSLGHARYTADYVSHHFIGTALDDICVIVEAETGARLSLQDFTQGYVARVEASIDALEAVPQAFEAVSACAERLAVCVASNGERPNVIAGVRIAGLATLFPEARIFTKDMVARGKPAPDLFLHAANIMGCDPARALVIEDSVPGVRAGKAAGMIVAGFTGVAHDREAAAGYLRAAGADIVFDRLMQVPGYIGQ